MHRKSRLALLAALVLLGLPLAAASAGSLALRSRASSVGARAQATIGPRMKLYHVARWERPVLRGEAAPGNAAALQLRAAARFEKMDDKPFEAFAARLQAGKGMLPALSAAAAEEAPALAELRRAAQADHAITVLDLEAWPKTTMPQYRPVL